MNELSIINYTHAIITRSGAHHLITNEQNENLKLVALDGVFEIEGSTIVGNDIVQILTIDKYYETYPEKRPAPRRDDWTRNGYDGLINNAGRNHKQGLQQMIKAMEKFIQRWPNSPNAEKLLEKMKEKANG